MVTLYKITDSKGQTQNNTQWGESVTHKAKNKGKELCTNQVIHAYRDPYLAVFHNPIGGDYNEKTMRVWEAKGKIVVYDGMKVGCKTLTTTKEIPVPSITTEQRVEIAIRCAVQVYKDPSFIKWADSWLSGEAEAAEAAWVAEAAWAAARAARAAAGAAEAAARAAAGAAEAAARAAAGAAGAARAAAGAAGIDLIGIIYSTLGKIK